MFRIAVLLGSMRRFIEMSAAFRPRHAVDRARLA